MEFIKSPKTVVRVPPNVNTKKLEKAMQVIPELPDDPFESAATFSGKFKRGINKVVYHYEKQNGIIEQLLELLKLPPQPMLPDLRTLSVVLRDVGPLIKENAEYQLQALKDIYALLECISDQVQEGFDLRFYTSQATPGRSLLKILSRRPLGSQLRRLTAGAKLLQDELKKLPGGKGMMEAFLDSTADIRKTLDSVFALIEEIKPLRTECKR